MISINFFKQRKKNDNRTVLKNTVIKHHQDL